MTLGEIIKEYREKNGLSMGAFSERSGISKAYIAVLEKNQHPRTGKPIAPSIKCIRQAAAGMHLDFDTLFAMLDGEVSLSDDEMVAFTNEEVELLRKYRQLSERDKGYINGQIDLLSGKKEEERMEDNIDVG